MMNRRDLLKAGVGAMPMLAGVNGLGEPASGHLGAEASLPAPLASDPVPWPRLIRRAGQTNMTEHDPVSMNVDEWAEYWSRMKVGATFVSVTGILAYYQTKVPFHKKGKYLGNRDFFGDCFQAAKKHDLKVIARMSPDLNWVETAEAHPEWFERDGKGDFVPDKEDPRLLRTCMFSSYMTDYIPAIMREVTSLYDVDAVFTNGWPPLGTLPVCHCDICRNLPTSGTPAYWDKFNDRVEQLWTLYNTAVKLKNAKVFYFANLGGGARSSISLSRFGKVCEWFQGDNQGRGGEASPVWLVTVQGRVCQAIQEGKMATNVTGAWSTGPIRWRNVMKPYSEIQMWLSETSASGMVPYYHIVGNEKGNGEDKREIDAPLEYFAWTAKHDPHFVNKRTIANIGMVIGQSTHLFYKPQADATMQQFLDGMYYALLEGRFFFDFVHEDKMAPEQLSKYTALILPNIALLSDAQCEQLRAYVKAGGSLLATFETSMYDEKNQPRKNFGLADVFGIEKAGDVIGTNGNAFYARIEREHAILNGFHNTNWLPGAQYRLPIAPVDNPVLTVVPGFVAYPPELAYPPISNTKDPVVVLREQGRSRTAYFCSDIERCMWVAGHTDLSLLLQNAIRWIVRDEQLVTIKGKGLIESFAYETQPGFALHVLNYTNPNTHRGCLREFYPIGAQTVRFSIPEGRHVSRVQLLKSEGNILFKRVNGGIEFTIPSVTEYEVAAIYA
jgi:hypothetical protein